MIIFKWLHPTWTSEKPQTHLLLGKFFGFLHTVIVAPSLQVDIYGARIATAAGWSRADDRAEVHTVLLVAHTDLALHGLNVTIIAIGFFSFPVQTELGNGWNGGVARVQYHGSLEFGCVPFDVSYSRGWCSQPVVLPQCPWWDAVPYHLHGQLSPTSADEEQPWQGRGIDNHW